MIDCLYEVEAVREAWVICFTVRTIFIALRPSHAVVISPLEMFCLRQSYSKIDTMWNIPTSSFLYASWYL